MQCTMAAPVTDRRPPRKTEAARTLRLRVLDRLALEIERRRERGRFTARHLAELLGDKLDGTQTGKDLTSVCNRRDVLGFDRLLQFVEALDMDIDTLFLPPSRRPM